MFIASLFTREARGGDGGGEGRGWNLRAKQGRRIFISPSTPHTVKSSVLRSRPALSRFYLRVQRSNQNTRKQRAVNSLSEGMKSSKIDNIHFYRPQRMYNATLPSSLALSRSGYIRLEKNITHQLEDMNFMFSWQEQYILFLSLEHKVSFLLAIV